MDAKSERIMEEWKAGVSLYQHEDNLKQSRLNGFLVLQGGLLVLLGLGRECAAVVIAVCAFGVVINLLLVAVLARSRKYAWMRGAQLRYLEARSAFLSTFRNEYEIFGKANWDVAFPNTLERMRFCSPVRKCGCVTWLSRRGAQWAEGLVPWLCLVGWIALAVVLTASVVQW